MALYYWCIHYHVTADMMLLMCATLCHSWRDVTDVCYIVSQLTWCYCCVLHCVTAYIMLLLCVTLCHSWHDVTVVCYIVSQLTWCYCCVLHCVTADMMLLLCATLCHSWHDVTVVCYIVSQLTWCYCCVLHCVTMMLLLCVTLSKLQKCWIMNFPCTSKVNRTSSLWCFDLPWQNIHDSQIIQLNGYIVSWLTWYHYCVLHCYQYTANIMLLLLLWVRLLLFLCHEWHDASSVLQCIDVLIKEMIVLADNNIPGAWHWCVRITIFQGHDTDVLQCFQGARLSVDECQYQFEDRRWNCPIADDSHGQAIFGKILRKGNEPCRQDLLQQIACSLDLSNHLGAAYSDCLCL